MLKTKITTKGQITVPKQVRERMGLRKGDVLEFVEKEGVYSIRKTQPPAQVKKYRGRFNHLNGLDSDRVIEELRG
jgi:AbrB family looped-hinge helix DNA binding protein